MTGSTMTPRALKQPMVAKRKATALSFFSSGKIGTGDTGMVVDGNVDEFPANLWLLQ
jgi:hypothetical protein